MDALAALQSTERVSVLVIGDVMLDAYLIGQVNRISPEAPVPVVDVQQRDKRLGGAANVAKNLIALGAKWSWQQWSVKTTPATKFSSY
jgi:bifunctional ADP-heptose synthase (sugar kinase/adenylyltransferase)